MAWKRPDLDLYEQVDVQDFLETIVDARVVDLLEEKVPAISPAASVRELLYRMVTEKKLAFVVWRNKPHGIVTYHDALLSFASGKSAKATKVSEIVGNGGVYAASPDTRVLPLLLWMTENTIPMVAIYDGEAFQGIFTASTALEHLAKLLTGVRKAPTA